MFSGRLEKDIVESVVITNTTDASVLYRVRTTCSDRYRVKPKLAVVRRGDSVNVTIHRKPVSEEQLAQQKRDDKFKFIACRVPASVVPSLATKDDMERCAHSVREA